MSTNDRPDVLVGRKLPAHALWEQLQRRAQPLALEFCSSFFNNEMSYQKAKKWLEDYGIKVSQTALQGFYNSMDMRLRYAALQAAQSADTAKAELPADIEQATKDRIAQHKFELAFMNLGESQRLQLIQIQQNEDGMKGNFALKRERLKLDREKFELEFCEKILDQALRDAAEKIASSGLTQAAKIAAMRKAAFADVDALQASGKLKLPKA
jgi:hypothetical protein